MPSSRERLQTDQGNEHRRIARWNHHRGVGELCGGRESVPKNCVGYRSPIPHQKASLIDATHAFGLHGHHKTDCG
jgi:hypothetical protein